MATQYVFQDRTTVDKWALTMADGQPVWTATGDAAQADPVILDFDDEVTLWTVFVDDGQPQAEVAGAVETPVVLTDTVTAVEYVMGVEDSTLAWRPGGLDAASPSGGICIVVLRRRRR